jgi:hypothetical protein
MKHTFASSSRHPASCRPSLAILGSCVTNEGTCKNVCNAEHFRAKAIHFSIGHFPLLGFLFWRRLLSWMPTISVSLMLVILMLVILMLVIANFNTRIIFWRTETANQRGGSEWEPIKILSQKNSTYIPIATPSHTQTSGSTHKPPLIP